jgi:hypothetical protein
VGADANVLAARCGTHTEAAFESVDGGVEVGGAVDKVIDHRSARRARPVAGRRGTARSSPSATAAGSVDAANSPMNAWPSLVERDVDDGNGGDQARCVTIPPGGRHRSLLSDTPIV